MLDRRNATLMMLYVIFVFENEFSAGCCIRNVLGVLVKVKSTSFHPKVAEAFALWEVLKWLLEE